MPLLKKWEDGGAVWAVWEVTEGLDELLERFSDTAAWREEVRQLRSASRQLECTAVRVLLKELTGRELDILHYPSGRPYVADFPFHLTISHTKGYVAVGCHPSSEVGIDIEYYGERVRKVASRFMRPDEMPERERESDSSSCLYQLLLHWSAKETIYKLMDCEEVDFLEHLRIRPFILQDEGCFVGEEYRTKHLQTFSVRYMIYPGFVCTWSLPEK